MLRTTTFRNLTCAVFASLTTAVLPVQAQSFYPLDTVIASLSDEATELVRSLDAGQKLPLSSRTQIPPGYDLPAFQADIAFDKGTHVLTSKGMTVLRTMAAALLEDGLADSRFQVGVHVADNNAQRAMQLSLQRAAVISEHLSVFYGIPQGRLVPVGYGNVQAFGGASGQPAIDRTVFTNVDTLQD